jgi:hypothetical protein
MIYFVEKRRDDGATEISVHQQHDNWRFGLIVKTLDNSNWNVYRMGVPGRETCSTKEEALQKFYGQVQQTQCDGPWQA